MEKEDRSRGNITWKIYIDYWKAGAGVIKILLLVLFLLGAQVNFEHICCCYVEFQQNERNKLLVS